MGLRVRTVKTASGATAVQVVEYREGTRRVIEHVGSAHTDEQITVITLATGDAETILDRFGPKPH